MSSTCSTASRSISTSSARRTPELDALTAELAEVYEAKAQFRKFAETLTAGCGPHCGTEAEGGGCGSGGCSTCAVVRRVRQTERRETRATENGVDSISPSPVSRLVRLASRYTFPAAT